MTTITVNSAPPSAHIVWESSDLPSGTHTIRVDRTADGITETVRGASDLFADGGAVLDDGGMPVGVLVSYTAEAFNTDGVSLGPVAAVTGQAVGDPSMGWISDPTNPTLVVQVGLKGDFANTLKTTRQVQTYQIGPRVIALLGSVGKLEDLNFNVQTDTLEDGALLGQILAKTAILIRTTPPVDAPRLLYVVLPQVSKTGTGSLNDLQYGGGSALWQGTAVEISPNTLDILIPLVTYQTYMDAFPGATYADVMAVYTGTYLDAIKNPPGA